MSVLLVTSKGDIVIDVFTDEAPLAARNFLKLAKIKYFYNTLFHRVEQNHSVQTGDPTGKGTGGDSIYGLLGGPRFFKDEFTPELTHASAGTVSMVNAGPDQNGSQFFITTRDGLDYLNEKHTVFGEVAEGMDIVMQINDAYVDGDMRPYQIIRIKKCVVLDDPFDDPPGLQKLMPDASPSLDMPLEWTEGRLGEDDTLEDEVDTRDEKTRMEQEDSKQAKSRAEVLEMIGDLPDADVEPPDNVLFVCKLNPVTTDEDLEIIFARFGTIIKCEIIREPKTGESLQYAFIEFESPEACEKAYFKMDNVLIDDRHIHVDFSQSVSKLKGNPNRKAGVEQNMDYAQIKLKSRTGNNPQFKGADQFQMVHMAPPASGGHGHRSGGGGGSGSRGHHRSHRDRDRGRDERPPRKKSRWDSR